MDLKKNRQYLSMRTIGSLSIVLVVLVLTLIPSNIPPAEATVSKTPCLVLLPLKIQNVKVSSRDVNFLNMAFSRLLRQNRGVIVKGRGSVYEFFENDRKKIDLAARSRRDLSRAGRALGVDGFLLPVVKARPSRNCVTLALHYFSSEMARVSWVREHIEPLQTRHGRQSRQLKAYMRAFARNISSLTPQLKLLLAPAGSGRRTYEALPPSPMPFFQRALDFSAFAPTPIATEGYERGVEQLDLRLTDFAARDRVLGETPVKAALVRYQRKGSQKRGPYALRVVDLDSPTEAKRYIAGMFPDMPAHGLAGVDVRAVRYDKMDFSAVGTALGKFAIVAEGPKGAESDLVELLRQAIRTNRRIATYYRNNPHHPGRTKVVEKPVKPWAPPKEPVIKQTIDEATIRRIVLEVLKPLGVLPQKGKQVQQAPTPKPFTVELDNFDKGVSLPPATVQPTYAPQPTKRPKPTKRPRYTPPTPTPRVTRKAKRVKNETVNEGARIQTDIAKRLMMAHRFEKAAKHFKRALKMDPDYGYARQQLVMLHEEHGIPFKAEKRVPKAPTKKPQRVEPIKPIKPQVTLSPIAPKIPTASVTSAPTPTVKIKPTKKPTKELPPVKIIDRPSFPTAAVTTSSQVDKAVEKTPTESATAFDSLTDKDLQESSAQESTRTTQPAKATTKEKLKKLLYSKPFGVFLILVSILFAVVLYWRSQERELDRQEYLHMLAAATSAAREIEEATAGGEEEKSASDLRARLEKKEEPPQLMREGKPPKVETAKEDKTIEAETPAEPAAPAVITVDKGVPKKAKTLQRLPTRKTAPFVEDTQVTKKNPLFTRLKEIRDRVSKKRTGQKQSMLPEDSE